MTGRTAAPLVPTFGTSRRKHKRVDALLGSDPEDRSVANAIARGEAAGG